MINVTDQQIIIKEISQETFHIDILSIVVE